MRRLVALVAAVYCLGAAPTPVALQVLLADTPAPELSDYRLFMDAAGRKPKPELTPYSLNTPLFSDYAEKLRFAYLPAGTHASYTKTGVLDFPIGAALIKTFAYPADLRRPDSKLRYVETRLLIRKSEGWTAQTYVWNRDQTRAVLKRAGLRIPIQVTGQAGERLLIDYAVPNANQCKECHALNKVMTPIGPKARNLNGDFAYGRHRENQLAHWTRTGLLIGAPAAGDAPRAAVWNDQKAPVADRARAYLDGNCGHCHNPAGMASNSGLFLNLETENPSQQGVGKRPVAAGRGSGDLSFDIAPGQPDASILLYRMASREPGVMMPELGRSLTHKQGLELIRQYLAAMPR